jgi:hypothetical protein
VEITGTPPYDDGSRQYLLLGHEITQAGAAIEFSIQRDLNFTAVDNSTSWMTLLDGSIRAYEMKFLLDASIPGAAAGTSRFRLSILETTPPATTPVVVYTDSGDEIPGTRYRVQVVGTEIRYYRDYAGPGSVPIYRSLNAVRFPLVPRVTVSGEHDMVNIVTGGLPLHVTTYSFPDQLTDGLGGVGGDPGTAPSTLRFRVYEEIVVAGVSLLGDAADFTT